MLLPIEGLEILLNEETEDFYYFNDKMLKDGVFIKLNTLENPKIEMGKRGCLDSYLEVGCLDDNGTKAGYYILYWDSLLSGIQLYQMIKNVYEIYMNSTYKDGFIDDMENLSDAYRDSTMEGRLDLVLDVKKEIELIKHLAD